MATRRASSKTRPRTGRPARRARAASGGATAKLAAYRSRCDFGRTPEPRGNARSLWKTRGNPFFVIHKHAATRLHYDLRLEMDGVLKSWAVPKGPSMDPAEKRLAVQTEDHPIDYADFEGVIPEDEYGAGTVIVWDAGPYRNLKRRDGRKVPLEECHRKGRIEVWLEGRKIRGGFALVHSRVGDNEKNWLLVKMKDETAGGSDPVARKPRSVLSGRTLREVGCEVGQEIGRRPRKARSPR